ncbi:histidine kinase, partial [Francisellaceae bacterium]|nr:histidine kinase [Francisellaceae bacterium]
MKKLGIRARIILLTIVPTVTISLLLGFYFISMRISDLRDNLISEGEAITSELTSDSIYGLLSGNVESLQRVTDHSFANAEVLTAAVYSNEGKLIAYSG